MTSTDSALILDRGYRRFEGRRSGTIGAMRSVTWHALRSILGLGRKARHKVFPVIVVVFAFLPAIAFLALAALIGDLLDGGLRPEYWEIVSFGFFTPFAIVLFAAFVAPEALVRDRRDGMFSLYLSTPLTRFTYLAAKFIAVIGALAILVIGPALFLLVGYTFQGQGPDGFVEWITVLGRVVAAGLAMAVVFAAVSLAASSLTDRRAIASVAVVMLIFGSFIVSVLLIETADMSRNLLAFDSLRLPFELAPRFFGADGTFPQVSTPLIYGANLGWVAASAGLIWYRYRRIAAV